MKRAKKITLVMILTVTLIMGTTLPASAAIKSKSPKFISSVSGLELRDSHISENTMVFIKGNTNKGTPRYYLCIGQTDTGKLIKTKYREARTSDINLAKMSDGMLSVKAQNKMKYTAYGKTHRVECFGYVNRNGKEIYPCKFIRTTDFKKDKALVSYPKNGKIYTSLIDKKGNYLLTLEVPEGEMGAKYISFAGEKGNVYYDYNGNYKPNITEAEIEGFNTVGYSQSEYEKFMKSNKSKYEKIQYAGQNRFICTDRSKNVNLVNSSNKKILKFGTNCGVKFDYMSDGKTLFYYVNQYGKKKNRITIFRSDGKAILKNIDGMPTLTEGDCFLVASGSNQKIYDNNGRLITSHSGLPLLTNEQYDGRVITPISTDFWTPTSGKACIFTSKSMKSISTSNLRALIRKLGSVKLAGDKIAQYNRAAYSRAVALSRQSKAKCVEVWGAEAFISYMIQGGAK